MPPVTLIMTHAVKDWYALRARKGRFKHCLLLMNLKGKLKIIQNKGLPGFVSVAQLSHLPHDCFTSSDVRVHCKTLSGVTANVTFWSSGLSDGKNRINQR